MSALRVTPRRRRTDDPWDTRLASTTLRTTLIGVILLLLAALVLVPPLIARRTDALRERMTRVVVPAREALEQGQAARAEARFAAQGYQLAGDTLFLAHMRDALARQRTASSRLAALAPELGSELVAAVAELRADTSALAAARARQALDRAERALARRIEVGARGARRLVALLSLLALSVAVVVTWLVLRLHRTARQLHTRAELLRESEERFRLIAENLHETIWISDPGYTVQYYLSPAYETIWGRPAEVARQQPRSFLEGVHPDDRARVEAALEGYARGDYRVEYRVVRPDGQVRWVAGRAYPVFDEHGTVMRVVGIAEDITRQKQSAAEREQVLAREQRAREETEAALQMRDRVLRTVSHDLKNPLHTIGMAAELLEMPLDDELRGKQLAVIQRTVARANRLVSDLLDAARLESGQGIVVQSEPVPVRALLTEAVEAFRLQAGQKQLQLDCEAGEDVGMVVGDRDRLLQVLSNLLGNAIKFTPAGGRVTVRAEPRADGSVHFTVADTGPGIHPDLLPTLFQPFSQEKATASAGSGLGLAIARAVVEAHGGGIVVESTVGEGSVFRFSIPAPARGE